MLMKRRDQNVETIKRRDQKWGRCPELKTAFNVDEAPRPHLQTALNAAELKTANDVQC